MIFGYFEISGRNVSNILKPVAQTQTLTHKIPNFYNKKKQPVNLQQISGFF